jgi:alpha-tubulin suppressor-like RCC1 family protein
LYNYKKYGLGVKSMHKPITLLMITICFFTIFGVIFKENVSAKTSQEKFIEVSSVHDRIIALKSDGTLWEWYYPVKDNFDIKSVSFTQVKGISNIISFTANEDFCLVIKKDGTIWGWGKNRFGQLGDGTFIEKNKPVQVKNISRIKEIAINQNHCIALKDDGTVWVWGDAGYGTGSANGSINIPVKVKELSKVKTVSVGEGHFAVLKLDGSVWTWGYRSEAMLGYAPISLVPRQVPGLSNIIEMSSNSHHTIALKKNGAVYVWGDDTFISHKLGGNSSANIVKYEVNGFKNVIKLYAGVDNSFVWENDGTLWAWGTNSHGQLGIGSAEDKGIPVKINSINKVIQISADYVHTVFLKVDGTI